MNRLANMISELCPDGVEYKTIGEIATDIFRGSGIKRDDITEYGIPCVRYGEIYTTYDIWFDKCISHVQLNKVQSPKYFEYGDILFAITGESIEDIAKSVAYVGHDKCLAGGDIVVVKHNQDPKYLSYALSTTNAQKQKSAGKIKSKVVHASVPSISGIVIPIPPLQVQHEIVRILDSFTEFTTKLITELTTERTARKKQYEYYREQLMIFDDVPYVPIDTLFSLIRNGFVGTVTKFFTDKENGIRYLEGTNIHNGVISDNEELYVTKEFHNKHIKNELKADDILMVQSGHIGECAVVGEKYKGANCHALIIMSNSGKCVSKFYVHYFHTMEGMRHLKPAITDGNLKHVLSKKMCFVKVPYPPIEKQKRIVDILDRFEALCNDITNGLPAEIAARQKQYEYYRDKLLTFKNRN